MKENQKKAFFGLAVGVLLVLVLFNRTVMEGFQTTAVVPATVTYDRLYTNTGIKVSNGNGVSAFQPANSPNRYLLSSGAKICAPNGIPTEVNLSVAGAPTSYFNSLGSSDAYGVVLPNSCYYSNNPTAMPTTYISKVKETDPKSYTNPPFGRFITKSDMVGDASFKYNNDIYYQPPNSNYRYLVPSPLWDAGLRQVNCSGIKDTDIATPFTVNSTYFDRLIENPNGETIFSCNLFNKGTLTVPTTPPPSPPTDASGSGVPENIFIKVKGAPTPAPIYFIKKGDTTKYYLAGKCEDYAKCNISPCNTAVEWDQAKFDSYKTAITNFDCSMLEEPAAPSDSKNWIERMPPWLKWLFVALGVLVILVIITALLRR